MEYRAEYESMCEELGTEGLTKEKAYEFLCDIGQNPDIRGLDFLDYRLKKEKGEDELWTLEELDELNKLIGDPRENLRTALKFFDRNGDEKVNKEELRELLEATDVYGCGVYQNDEEYEKYWQDTLNFGDKDGDELLDIDELVTLLSSRGITL